MAGELSTLTAISALALGDAYEVLDVSDTTMAASGSNRKATHTQLVDLLRLNGMPRTCKQSAEITNSSNSTPTDITGLSFAITSGRRYWFKFAGVYQSAATTTGIGFTFSGPAITWASWRARIRQAANGTDSFYEGDAQALTTVTVSASVIAATTDYFWEVEGLVQPSADGTLQLRARSEVNASQITVRNAGIGFLIDAG
jgi:hypothetical protein